MRLPVWPARRLVQVLVLCLLLYLPMLARVQHYLTARQTEKLEEQWRGTLQGNLLRATEGVLRVGLPDGEGGVPTRKPRKAMLARAHQFYGSPWSMKAFGVSATDVLAGAESTAASRGLASPLLIGLTIPLIVTLLFGRVFCSWICPMGLVFELTDKLRGLLTWLELPPLKIRFWAGNKYLLVAAGLLLGTIAGLPLLHFVYPPAVLSREVHGFLMALFDRAEAGRFGLALVGLSSGTLFLVGIALIEVALAPRFWCSTLCPGGALYAALGALRSIRVRRNTVTCTRCGECDALCPMALHPMSDRTGVECDNCGICIDVCPERSLVYRFSLSSAGFQPPAPPAATAVAAPKPAVNGTVAACVWMVALLAGAASVAHAHHIIGIPHYAYDQNYPQAPVLKLLERVGSWDFQLTSYPGTPTPGERTEIHLYVADAATRAVYRDSVRIEVFAVSAFGANERVYGPCEDTGDEKLFKFQPVYPADGNYEIVFSFPDGDVISTLRFPMVVGEPGSPFWSVGLYAAGLLCFVVVIRAIRIKRERRRRAQQAVGA